MKKVILNSMIILVLMMLLVACGSNQESSSGSDGSSSSQNNTSSDESQTDGTLEKYEFSVAHNAPADSHYDQWAQKFKEKVEEENENITIKIHSPGSLGAERELIESVLNGSLDIAISSDAPVVNFSDAVGALSFPFLFENEEHAYEALDGEVGEKINKSMEEANLKNLAWMETGFYQIFSNEPIRTLNDLDGIDIRAQESQVQIDFLEALGTNPTPVSFGELYVSAEQGVIDAFTSSFATAVPNNLHEVSDYMTINNLFYSSAVNVMNNDKFNDLPSSVQDTLLNAAKEATSFERNFIKEQSVELRATAEEEGLEIIEDVDNAPFVEAVQPVYDKYSDKYGDIHQKIFELKE
ncbi:TRAP transporter substrate-binding protein [Virgibacillus byunsanensis]|uniref:TRAP transporter substrate-binding protein n=1 Tax=Virgibacillus byunsanensis TaxID=570945 RepID=A0ABW3LLZ5_9BACI